jgi:hypothetical protein
LGEPWTPVSTPSSFLDSPFSPGRWTVTYPDTAYTYDGIGAVYNALGRPAEALEEQRKALEVRRAALGERRPVASTASTTRPSRRSSPIQSRPHSAAPSGRGDPS